MTAGQHLNEIAKPVNNKMFIARRATISGRSRRVTQPGDENGR